MEHRLEKQPLDVDTCIVYTWADCAIKIFLLKIINP